MYLRNTPRRVTKCLKARYVQFSPAFGFALVRPFLPWLASLEVCARSNIESIAFALVLETRIASNASGIRTTYEANWQHPFCLLAHC